MTDVPALFWELNTEGMGFTLEYDNGGGWTSAGQILLSTGTTRNMLSGVPNASLPVFFYSGINTAINGILGGGTVDFEITEIDAVDDAVGGLRARRFKLVDNNAAGVEVRWSDAIAGSITVAGAGAYLGGGGTENTTSGEYTFPRFYDGCFMLPDRMAHDWRSYQKVSAGITVSQSTVVAPRVRKKIPCRNFKWIVAPAAFVRKEAANDSNFRTRAGLASASDTNNTFEHFWDEVILDGDDFYFATIDPDDWSSTNTAYDTMVVSDVGHITDFESMISSRLMDMGWDDWDIEFRAIIKSSSTVDTT